MTQIEKTLSNIHTTTHRPTNNGLHNTKKHPHPSPLIACSWMSNKARCILFLIYPPPLPNTLTPQDRLLFISPKETCVYLTFKEVKGGYACLIAPLPFPPPPPHAAFSSPINRPLKDKSLCTAQTLLVNIGHLSSCDYAILIGLVHCHVIIDIITI